jgi:hypothetical protein
VSGVGEKNGEINNKIEFQQSFIFPNVVHTHFRHEQGNVTPINL